MYQAMQRTVRRGLHHHSMPNPLVDDCISFDDVQLASADERAGETAVRVSILSEQHHELMIRTTCGHVHVVARVSDIVIAFFDQNCLIAWLSLRAVEVRSSLVELCLSDHHERFVLTVLELDDVTGFE